MKKIVFSMLVVCLLGTVWAQNNKCGIDTKALLRKEVASGATHVSFLAKMKPGFSEARLGREGIVVGARAGDIVTLRVPVGQLEALDSDPDVLQYSIAHRVGGTTMDKTRADTKTNKVEAGNGVIDGNGYDGSGVLIGITDWGFDYTHPNYNNGGSKNRRIERAWDHYRLAGPAPEGFSYGTEIVGYADLKKAKGDTSNIYGYGTHGTHVAGITAGAGTENGRFRGQAPGAHLLLCSFGLNESDWLDGVAWMKNVAEESGKRLVVNSSWGMYSFSCLDGKSLLSQAINNMSDEGVVFVTSAGNNGETRFHISRDFDKAKDTLKTTAAYYTYAEDAIGQCLIMWGEEGHDFSARFRMENNDGTVWLGPENNTAKGDTIISDTLLCDSIAIPYHIIAEHANPFDNRPHIQMDVDRGTGLQLQLFFVAESGTVHAWNVANKTNHAGNEGASFNNGGHDDFSTGNDLYGVGEPGCAAKTITVAAHSADNWSSDSSTVYPGDLTYFSSYGPLIDGTQKPEISAPGYQVVSSISYWSDTKYSPSAEYILNAHTYIWSRMSGTSMSGPAVTGIVALMLQANPEISTDEVREALFSNARNDAATGDLVKNDSASIRWGWGKADALAAVNAVLKKLSIEDVERMQLPLHVYPNPASGTVTVNTGCGERQTMHIYNMNGVEVLQLPVETECTVNLDFLKGGVYVVRVGSRTEKLIIR